MNSSTKPAHLSLCKLIINWDAAVCACVVFVCSRLLIQSAALFLKRDTHELAPVLFPYFVSVLVSALLLLCSGMIQLHCLSAAPSGQTDPF